MSNSLADTVLLAATHNAHTDASRLADFKSLARAVTHAARYRIDRDAEDFVRHIANQMTDKPQQVAQVNMPFGLCFFEFPWSHEEGTCSSRTGFLWVGRLEDHSAKDGWTDIILERAVAEGSTSDGTLVVAHERDDGKIMFTSGVMTFKDALDPVRVDHTFFRTDEVTANQLTDALGHDQFVEYMDSTGFIAAALAAVLTSPKVINTRPTDYRKLNINRVKAGKPPLLSQREIMLKIPKPEQTRNVSSTNASDEPSRKKIRHMVSLFTRFKGGKIEVVSPHWRGDASVGIKLPSYFAKGK